MPALQKSEKEKEGLRVDLQNFNVELKECKVTIVEMQKERERLQKMIKQADQDREHKQNALDQVTTRDDMN